MALLQINDLIVRMGYELKPQAIASVRGDTFVVETSPFKVDRVRSKS